MNPIKSIQARYQAYTMAHFEKSKYAKKLREFKNIHKGETCFIIGNGPSLSSDDLELIHQKNIPTFAFNRIYFMFDKTQWRPTYYISQDEKTLSNCQTEVNEMNLDYKFIPLFHKYYHNINIDNALYFKLAFGNKDGKLKFSEDISCYFGDSSTVACTAVQFAVYMGFKKIYLIGVDHNFSVYRNSKGEIIHDDKVKDYFAKEYNSDKEELYIPNLDSSTMAYISVKEYCDKNGIEIYNATRGGKLEVFERADFDKLF